MDPFWGPSAESPRIVGLHYETYIFASEVLYLRCIVGCRCQVRDKLGKPPIPWLISTTALMHSTSSTTPKMKVTAHLASRQPLSVANPADPPNQIVAHKKLKQDRSHKLTSTNHFPLNTVPDNLAPSAGQLARRLLFRDMRLVIIPTGWRRAVRHPTRRPGTVRH